MSKLKCNRNKFLTHHNKCKRQPFPFTGDEAEEEAEEEAESIPDVEDLSDNDLEYEDIPNSDELSKEWLLNQYLQQQPLQLSNKRKRSGDSYEPEEEENEIEEEDEILDEVRLLLICL